MAHHDKLLDERADTEPHLPLASPPSPARLRYEVEILPDGSIVTTIGEATFSLLPVVGCWDRYFARVRALLQRSRLQPFVKALAAALIASVLQE